MAILYDLWTFGPSTVREVHERLYPIRTTRYTTILKQMQQMLEKGLLSRNERFLSHLYEPTTPSEEMQAILTRDLLKRAFEGSVKNLILGALSEQSTTKEELAEMRQSIDRLLRKGRERRSELDHDAVD
jgi:predicted transcriptional regulator